MVGVEAPATWRLDPVCAECWQGVWWGRCGSCRGAGGEALLCAGRGGRVPGSSEPGRRSGHGGPAGPAALPSGMCCFRLGIATGAAVASGPRSDCPAARQPQPPHAGASGKGALRGEHVGRGTDADPAATSTWRPDCLSPLPAGDTRPQHGGSETRRPRERFARLPLRPAPGAAGR